MKEGAEMRADLLDRPALRGGQVLVAGERGPKLLVLAEGERAGVLSCDGIEFHADRPDPCSRMGIAEGASADQRVLREGDRLKDHVTGVVLRCIRSGAGEVTCDGRPMAVERTH
jgi:hypothetical protein